MILHLLFEGLAVVCAILVLPLVVELLFLSLAALLPAQKARPVANVPLRIAVVIPAHNEDRLIVQCIASLRASTVQPDDIYVIAHNCSDGTVDAARDAGASVLSLNDDGTEGKGAALRFGFAHAMQEGQDAAMVVDADSIVSAHLIAETSAALRRGADAVQPRYVFAETAQPSPRSRLMALALVGINVVRPLGRQRLGLSCGIFGNGFTLTAATLRAVPYTASSVVEDVEYHLMLVRSGRRVTFLNAASVYGELPDNTAAASTQRARWQGGRARMRREFVPVLFREVAAGKARMLEPLFDLLSLPVGTGAVLLFTLLVIPLAWSRALAVIGLAAYALYVAVSAVQSGRPREAFRSMLAVPAFLLHKIALVPATRRAAAKDSAWVRTERNRGDDR